jgi:Phosphohistidine phosphatase SixA
MKKLYLMRHAKSSWDNTELQDFDRPLNKHGRKDTHLMAEFLQTQQITLDLILSSPAKRAITTANILAEALHIPVKQISSDQRIYEAGVETLLEVLADIDSAHQHVLLLGHDPGLSWLAAYLGNEEHVSLPTCGIYGLQVKAESWKSLNKAEIKKLFFEFPTDLHDPT